MATATPTVTATVSNPLRTTLLHTQILEALRTNRRRLEDVNTASAPRPSRKIPTLHRPRWRRPPDWDIGQQMIKRVVSWRRDDEAWSSRGRFPRSIAPTSIPSPRNPTSKTPPLDTTPRPSHGSRRRTTVSLPTRCRICKSKIQRHFARTPRTEVRCSTGPTAQKLTIPSTPTTTAHVGNARVVRWGEVGTLCMYAATHGQFAEADTCIEPVKRIHCIL
mmetsp:Transcript_10878/g.19044  ORF Transcript_10878/g.19044 Transcript_10878/m.19044 type:complete len:219 (-) Transcript_10878:1134-1790(-)